MALTIRYIKYGYNHLFFFIKNHKINKLTTQQIIMRYQTDNKYRKYVQGYEFLSFARNFANKYGKQLMDTTKEQGTKFIKTSGEKILKKSAIATGDLIGNKIADKTTSLGNKKDYDQNKNEINKEQEEIIIPPEKRQQIIDDLKLS